MKVALNRPMTGQRIPRNVRNLTGSSSVSREGKVVWKYFKEEKVARHSEERPTKERGRERERVG